MSLVRLPRNTFMEPTPETLIAQAAQMTQEERIQLVERISNSLDQPDAALDALWASEANDRLAAYRRGEITRNGVRSQYCSVRRISLVS